MSDTSIPKIDEVPRVSMRWVELPSGDTLCVLREKDGTVEGFRTLPSGKKIRFTATKGAWSRVVAKYGGL